MADMTFRLEQTGLLVVDPYNDFISEGGQRGPRRAGGQLQPGRAGILSQKVSASIRHSPTVAFLGT